VQPLSHQVRQVADGQNVGGAEQREPSSEERRSPASTLSRIGLQTGIVNDAPVIHRNISAQNKKNNTLTVSVHREEGRVDAR
jgi:hypothetical protein